MSDREKMTPDAALRQVLDVMDGWIENERDSIHDQFGGDACENPRDVLAEESTEDIYGELERYADTVEALAVLVETIRETSDDVQPEALLTEVTDAPDFETAHRIELIRNRAAFLHGMGDAAIGADWTDLSHMELVSRYGWVLTIDENTESHIDWPEDCRK